MALFLPELALAAENSPVSPYRTHPSLEEKTKLIKTIALLPPRVELFQLTAGGTTEKMDEWSAAAKKNLLAAFRQELTGKADLVVTSFPEDSVSEVLETHLEETYKLFDAVNWSIVAHTYGPPAFQFPEKLKVFDYSLGPEVRELSEGADAGGQGQVLTLPSGSGAEQGGARASGRGN